MNKVELYNTICKDLDYLTKKYSNKELEILIKSLKSFLKNKEV